IELNDLPYFPTRRSSDLKVARMLQRSDDGVVRAFQNSNDPTFASSFGSRIGWIASNARNYAIAVHGCASVLRCDENIRLARFLRDRKSTRLNSSHDQTSY